MKLIYNRNSIKLYRGDSMKMRTKLSDCSIDSVVTDPPYGLGFMGKTWDKTNQEWYYKLARKIKRVLKPGGHAAIFGGTRTFHRVICALEDAGFEIRDCLMWIYGSGFPKSKNLKEKWNGWGTSLKPAWEPIILVRKPLQEKTVELNVKKWGTGAVNIDMCRVPISGEVIHTPQSDPAKRKGIVGTDLGITRTNKAKFQEAQRNSIEKANKIGRWPANVVHDGSNEITKLFPTNKDGIAVGKNASKGNIYGGGKGLVSQPKGKERLGYGGEGSVARFFLLC